ncbi:MAG: type II toxin-antitoxin system HigB family toxin [Candidatus Accumulibacter sp. UW20]|jgi:mRNA interferase HigB
MKLISNKALRDFSARHPEADAPLQAFRRLIETGRYEHFSALRDTFRGVDKVGERFVFNIAGNKYRLIAGIHFGAQRLYVKTVLSHREYDKGDWK